MKDNNQLELPLDVDRLEVENADGTKTVKYNKGLIVKFPDDVYRVIQEYAHSIGVTNYEVMQLIGFKMAEFGKYKFGLTKELSAATQDLIESFGLDHDITEQLSSYRRLVGMHSVKSTEGKLQEVITVAPGGVVTTYDPSDQTQGFTGSVTMGVENALNLLLRHLPSLMRNIMLVMEDRGLNSPLRAVTEVLANEAQAIRRERAATDDLSYAHNEYGHVPVRHFHKNPLD